MPKLTVVRDTSIPDAFRAYSVRLDGKEIGDLKPGQSLAVDVAPGTHTLALKIDWCGSKTVEFDGGSEVRYAARSNLTGLRMLLGIFYVLFLKDEYLVLQQA